MAVIALDSSVLIEYYRKTDKTQSFLFKLVAKYQFAISAVFKYEVFKGQKEEDPFWTNLLSNIDIIPFDDDCAMIAADIYLDLRKKSKLIPTDDILIAATAIKHKMPIATINAKHFSRIKGLKILTP